MAHRGKGEEKSGMQGKGRKKGVQPVRTFKGEGKKAMCGEREKEKGVRPAAEERGRREREKRGCAQGKRRGEKGGGVQRKGEGKKELWQVQVFKEEGKGGGEEMEGEKSCG